MKTLNQYDYDNNSNSSNEIIPISGKEEEEGEGRGNALTKREPKQEINRTKNIRIIR